MRTFSQKELRPQVDGWTQAGLITTDQAVGILARYPPTAPRRWPVAFLILGGLLCLGGVILIVSSNWQAIPAPVKLGSLVALLAGSYVLGIETQRNGRSRAWWEIGYLGAAVFPFLGLMLVSQIFHLGGNPFTLLLMWTVAITPLPFLTRSVSAFLVWLFAVLSLSIDLPEGLHVPWWGFQTITWIVAGYGVACALASQWWIKVGESALREVGEYFGVVTALTSVFVLGCDLNHTWFAVWLLVFVASLGLIARGYLGERIHQVNVGFCFVGLVILATFLRLVGTMFDTGLIFIVGGLIIITGVSALEFLRRRVVARIKT